MAEKHPIRFGVQTGQQNVSWAELTELWSKADGWGYDSLWVFDHFYPIFVPDPTGPCMEGWTLLSALSQHTRRARLGARGRDAQAPGRRGSASAAGVEHLAGHDWALAGTDGGAGERNGFPGSGGADPVRSHTGGDVNITRVMRWATTALTSG